MLFQELDKEVVCWYHARIMVCVKFIMCLVHLYIKWVELIRCIAHAQHECVMNTALDCRGFTEVRMYTHVPECIAATALYGCVSLVQPMVSILMNIAWQIQVQ